MQWVWLLNCSILLPIGVVVREDGGRSRADQQRRQGNVGQTPVHQFEQRVQPGVVDVEQRRCQILHVACHHHGVGSAPVAWKHQMTDAPSCSLSIISLWTNYLHSFTGILYESINRLIRGAERRKENHLKSLRKAKKPMKVRSNAATHHFEFW